METKKAFAPLIIIVLIAVGLVGGTATGYVLREPIKKAVQGKNTTEEIDEAVELAKEKVEAEKDKEVKEAKSAASQDAAGQSKFELQGVVTALDATQKIVTVKIKSSTDSIKELRLSETPITLVAEVKIVNGSTESTTISDIPLNSQVHVGGKISDGKLTATKIIIQKEEVSSNAKHFSIGGTVTTVGTDSITVKVSTANKAASANKGKDLVIKVSTTTEIEKSDQIIALADIKAGDSVHVTGRVNNNVYTAAKIVVKVKEEAGKIEPTASTSSSSGKANGAASSNANKSNGGSQN